MVSTENSSAVANMAEHYTRSITNQSSNQ